MKTHFFKRGIAGLLSLVMCLSAFIGLGTTTAFAAGEQAEVYLISFPRSGDANLDYSGTWGHSNLHYMNGWYSGESKYTTIRAMHSYDGNICYCIEPGTPQDTGDRYTSKDETFWDNLPSDFNSTISPYDMKLFIGRIMQYGYTGPISTSWRSQNASDAETLAQAMATQVLIWETVVGERDEGFNHISPGSYDAVKSVVSTAHPLYSQFISYYNSIEASVQRHSAIPSFMAKTPGKAQNVELAWNGTNYTATLTDSNNVLSNYSFSANEDGISFSVSGNKLVITAATAPSDSVRITASKSGATRRGIITWTDGRYAPGSGIQDVISYAQEVNDPVQAFLNLKVSYGSAKIIKTSEDGKVDNLTFTVTGNGVNQTVKTNAKGEIQIDNLMPGVYTVTEMDYDKYEPQESRRVTVVSGQVSTVTFNNKLKRGDLQIVKSSEDNLNEGVTFHLYGTSLSGIAVDEYAVTDANGVATFEDVLISGSTPYTVEEVDTAIRYVVPEAQSAPINWNEVTNRSFLNILKKFSVTVTKSDAETGTAQGDASLAGAVYGIYKGKTLVDTYTTDKNGQFVTKEYICDNDWTVREITPSEGYLLDTTVHKVGAEPQLYTVEHNQTANDVTEQVVKGNIAIIKHTDNGDTQIETPENGAEFAVYLKAAGSYDSAKASERDYLTCDENGFAQTKDMPYGIYTVHQVSGWEGSEQMPDFDVFISQNGATYRYLINNAPFNSFIKIVKQDAETGKTIPYAGAGFKIYDPDGNPVTMTFTYPTPTTIDVFYGLINSRANISAFSQDSSFSLLSALEVLGDEGQLERKADIFYKRTIKPHTPVTSVDTASEALAVSMGEKARVDMDYMCELTGKTEEEIFADLKGVIFLNPMYGYGNSTQAKYLMADEYLSGNVREKLVLARKSAELYPEDYTVNVEALERVQPKDLTASEIAVRLGATWLPTEIVEQFMFEFLGTPRYAQWNIKVHFSAYTGEWNIEGKSYDRSNVKAYSTYGTGRINAYKIIEETLNLKDVRIFDYVEDADGKKKAILNKKETAIAQAKQELIKQGFQDWVWSDPERRERLCRLYNDKFNSLRPREYDGSHIVFSGMNPEIELREHQRNAVAHILYGGNTLLAHAVGAGKTFEMVSAAMESKRLGLCSKSLFVVPNHLTEQWASEFLQLYPSANILVATKKDFETKNRKKFCGRIATGDYDAIIIGHSQFEKIPMSIERQRAILEQQLDEVTEGITELKKNRGDNFSVKQLERTKKSVKQKLDKLNDQSKKDDTVTFEELGVDRLFIDESHYYKNLFLFTKMRNVGGIAQTEAMKSSDLFMKCRYLDELTGGRGTVFATGTPISNSMVELYTIQRYLQYNTLVQNNLQHFDAWASTFGETITAVELTPEGYTLIGR